MRKISEDFIQAQIVTFYTNNYCLKHHNPRGMIFSIPNGSFRNIREAVKLKNTGVLPGVSDLMLILPSRKLMFIECKTLIGKQGPAQKDFEERIKQLGFEYHIIKSLEDFKTLLP